MTKTVAWTDIGKWACRWISITDTAPIHDTPLVAAYRCRFSLDAAAALRLHVSADERYKLYLDGKLVGVGSERGEPLHWFYETYDFNLPAGEHVFVAVVWSLGDLAPVAQMSVYHGFFLSPEPPHTEILGTGIAAWEVRPITGYTFVDPLPAWGSGANLIINGEQYPWDIEFGAGDDWQKPNVHDRGISVLSDWGFDRLRVLSPAVLPPMLRQPVAMAKVRFVENLEDAQSLITYERPVDLKLQLAQEVEDWQAVLDGVRTIIIMPHTLRRVIIDLDNYYCAYPEVVTTGGQGSTIRLNWAESLYESQDAHLTNGHSFKLEKGNRNAIDRKYFSGTGDTFLPDGGEKHLFDTLWWQAGRYIELVVQTQSQSLTIERLSLSETRYPLTMEAAFSSSDERLERLVPLLVRGLQMCAHETYLDCPYYEQLMYSGDTRLQVLTTYVITKDDRLPRKAIQMFDYSRHWFGLTQSRYPNRGVQLIGSFSLWWIGMVYDYALWRDDPIFVKRCMAGVRATVEAYLQFVNEDGLVTPIPGWNFMDWVTGWEAGMPPDAKQGVSAVINWQFVLLLTLVAKLEDVVGMPSLAQLRREQASQLAKKLERFWSEEKGLYADDFALTHYSEHAQILAILSEQLPPERQARLSSGLLTNTSLSRASIYFHHYLFEAYRIMGEINALFERLSVWFDLPEKGLRTPVEVQDPTRSDCHGWGSHPLYHYFATLLGIRPGGAGFSSVTIHPQLGNLSHAKGTMPHPKGEIQVEYQQQGDKLTGQITLPAGITGTLHYGGHKLTLMSGAQTFDLRRTPEIEITESGS